MSDFNSRITGITIKLADTLVSKNEDYADSYAKSVEKRGVAVSLIRLEDKLNRYEKLINNPGSEKVDESIEDTLLDIAGYAILELERRARPTEFMGYELVPAPEECSIEELLKENQELKKRLEDAAKVRAVLAKHNIAPKESPFEEQYFKSKKPPYADLDD